MTPIGIAIAGGSGVGKSTLSKKIWERYPDDVEVLELDDYFKPSIEVPLYNGQSNRDHPDALSFDRFVSDIEKLFSGNAISIKTKSKRLNPNYFETHEKILTNLYPKKIILIEGYLVLHDPRVRSFLKDSLWLELDHETRWSRRVHFKDSEYEKNVLIPMHTAFVYPTKEYAGHIINVHGLSEEDVYEKAFQHIEKYIMS